MNVIRRSQRPRARRGIAAVAMIVAMLVLNLIITALVLSGGREQDLTLRRIETVRALYAAESGMNMSVKEMTDGNDDDGDGTVGTVSDDGNSANNPGFNNATFLVTSSVSGSDTTLTSTGTSGIASRKLQAIVQ